MKKRQLIGLMGCLAMMAAQSGFAAFYGRGVAGSWHETNNTWKVGGSFVSTLPGTSDVATLTSGFDGSIDLYEGAASVSSLIIGSYEATFTKTVTLNVQNALTVVNTTTIASGASHEGNGAMVVSGTTVSSGNLKVGQTSFGALTLNGGAVFNNVNWRAEVGTNGTITLNDGTLSMINGLVMTNGARVDINGSSELWLMNNDQTQSYDPLMKYIASGWIFGNGVAGNVEATWDGTKTIVTANSIGYAGFTHLYGITGEPDSDPYDDYDGDGQLNVYEYGLGGDPTNSLDIGTEPMFSYGADTNVTFSHVILTDPSADITYTVEQVDGLSLGTWTNSGWNLISTNATADSDFDEVQYRVWGGDKDKLFIRLRITQP